MSNNQNKSYLVLPGGKECRPVNPFDKDKFRIAHVDFEATNPTYAITEVMPEGEIFSGVEAWQNKGKSILEWTTNNQKLTEDDIAHLASNFITTRIAIKPLKAKEPVKEAELSPYFLNKIKQMEENTYGPGKDNYGRDKKPWDKPPVDELNLKKAANDYGNTKGVPYYGKDIISAFKAGAEWQSHHNHASFVALVEGMECPEGYHKTTFALTVHKILNLIKK